VSIYTNKQLCTAEQWILEVRSGCFSHLHPKAFIETHYHDSQSLVNLEITYWKVSNSSLEVLKDGSVSFRLLTNKRREN
jgi:hypothetical protein